MDYDGLNGIYRQQAPLRPPPTSFGASVSPRFDNIMARSSSIPWSPAPLDGNKYDKQFVEPPLTNQAYTKSSEQWTNNNPYTKSSEMWSISNQRMKSPETWANNNSRMKSPEMWPNNNPPIRPSEMLTNNNPYTKSSDAWTINNAQSKASELWSPNNTFARTGDSTLTSNNSSNAQMIKSSDKPSGPTKELCSPRCKLGILGFVIGFLVVGIALAVVMVLWLKK